ncbi:MAG: AAA family ATPase, partial [Candidatus Peribacteraceae bacterium]|nr:AAA family ATPase [Candidatus Peribacteraceae bacterium]
MNKLIFKKARVRNFLSYGNNWQEIEFPIGVNLVQGHTVETDKSNGSGKSSVTEIIPFALFGKTIKELPQSKVINWFNRGKCMVELYLESNGDEYVFKRGLKPNKFTVSCNGDDIVRPADIKTFQYQIENDIIGMDFKTFKNLRYFSPNNTISILGAKKDQKRQFLESLFDLSEYSDMLKLTNKKVGGLIKRVDDLGTTMDHNNQIIDMIDKDCADMVVHDVLPIQKSVNMLTITIEGLNDLDTFDRSIISGLDGLKGRLSDLTADREKFGKQQSTIKAQISSTQDVIDKIDITTPQTQADGINREISSITNTITEMMFVSEENLADKMVDIKEKITDIKTEKDDNQKEIINLQRKQELSQYVITSEEENISVINGREQNISGKDVCDFCGSECDHDSIKEHHEQQIREHDKRIELELSNVEKCYDEEMVLSTRNDELIELAKSLSDRHKECKGILSSK